MLNTLQISHFLTITLISFFAVSFLFNTHNIETNKFKYNILIALISIYSILTILITIGLDLFNFFVLGIIIIFYDILKSLKGNKIDADKRLKDVVWILIDFYILNVFYFVILCYTETVSYSIPAFLFLFLILLTFNNFIISKTIP